MGCFPRSHIRKQTLRTKFYPKVTGSQTSLIRNFTWRVLRGRTAMSGSCYPSRSFQKSSSEKAGISRIFAGTARASLGSGMGDALSRLRKPPAQNGMVHLWASWSEARKSEQSESEFTATRFSRGKKIQELELYFLLMFLDEFSFYFSMHFQGKLSGLIYLNPFDTFLSAFPFPWQRGSTCNCANVWAVCFCSIC